MTENKKVTTPPVKKLGRKPFYAEGLRFECQGSGKCCTSRGTYGFVYLTDEDIKRFAKHFKLTGPKFIAQYCNQKNGLTFLKDDPSYQGDCMFLEEKRCNAYEARPEQCRTWPFWPENMNPKAWNTDIGAYCPGVGKGKLHSYEEIQIILEQQKGLVEKGQSAASD